MLGIAALCCFHWWLTPSCSRQAGSSATGQGQSSALEWTLKISLPPPSTHLALGPCTLSTLVEGRATSARRCTVSCHITHPCQEHPWALGLHGTKIKAFSSSTNLEKKKKKCNGYSEGMFTWYTLLVRFSTKFNTLHVMLEIQALRA